MSERASLVFPIGHYVGERHPDSTHNVRIGLEHQLMTEDEFGVWVLAHGPGEIGRGAWTAEGVFELAEFAGIANAAATVDRLTAAGALVVLGTDLAAAVAFARSYRMESLLVGLGNTEEEPDWYAVGIPGFPPVAVLSAGCYELWQWGHLAPTLWHTCEVREKVATELGEPAPAVDLLDDLLGDLRELLVSGCAYLDVAWRG